MRLRLPQSGAGRIFLLVQAVGVVFLVAGSYRSIDVWGIGWVLLVPGTIIAALFPMGFMNLIPWGALHITGQDAANDVFFPLAILINAVLFRLLQRWLRVPETRER